MVTCDAELTTSWSGWMDCLREESTRVNPWAESWNTARICQKIWTVITNKCEHVRKIIIDQFLISYHLRALDPGFMLMVEIVRNIHLCLGDNEPGLCASGKLDKGLAHCLLGFLNNTLKSTLKICAL